MAIVVVGSMVGSVVEVLKRLEVVACCCFVVLKRNSVNALIDPKAVNETRTLKGNNMKPSMTMLRRMTWMHELYDLVRIIKSHQRSIDQEEDSDDASKGDEKGTTSSTKGADCSRVGIYGNELACAYRMRTMLMRQQTNA